MTTMETTGMALSGIIGLVLAVLFIVLAIFWLIFPWMVYAQLKSLIQGQKKLGDLQGTTQHILTKMERHLDGIESSLSPLKPLTVRIDTSPPTQPGSSPAQPAYYYSTDGVQQGPVAASDLKLMRKDGLITDDAPVLREGDSQWRTYRDFLALNR
jgi:hypothetical protein